MVLFTLLSLTKLSQRTTAISFTVHHLLQASTMADSSSVHDTSVRQPLLTIKPQQNMIIDLIPFIYEPYMLYVVEALTKVEVVPMSCLSLVYSTATTTMFMK